MDIKLLELGDVRFHHTTTVCSILREEINMATTNPSVDHGLVAYLEHSEEFTQLIQNTWKQSEDAVTSVADGSVFTQLRDMPCDEIKRHFYEKYYPRVKPAISKVSQKFIV